MEDGKRYSIEADLDTQDKRNTDKYINANGGSEYITKPERKNSLSAREHCSDNDVLTRSISAQDITLSKSKSKQETINQVVRPIPRPLLVAKHPIHKPLAKKAGEDLQVTQKVCKENGEHLTHTNVQSTSIESPIDEYALQKAIIKLHSSPNNKFKEELQQVSFKKRKVDDAGNSTQYLGLQPAVKFKCSKCGSTYPSLTMLKQHQLTCTPSITSSCRLPTPALSATTSAALAPQTSADTQLRFTRSVYLCSACGTYYENWNLFLHIREVHNRHTCLFCFGMFTQAHKLASHLVVKHNIQEDYFASKEDLSSKFSESFYLLCCKCEKIFTEREDFVSHECVEVIKQCSVCKLKGSHSPQCPKNSKIKKLNSLSHLDSKKGKINATFKPISEPPATEGVSGDRFKDIQVENKQISDSSISSLEIGLRNINQNISVTRCDASVSADLNDSDAVSLSSSHAADSGSQIKVNSDHTSQISDTPTNSDITNNNKQDVESNIVSTESDTYVNVSQEPTVDVKSVHDSDIIQTQTQVEQVINTPEREVESTSESEDEATPDKHDGDALEESSVSEKQEGNTLEQQEETDTSKEEITPVFTHENMDTNTPLDSSNSNAGSLSDNNDVSPSEPSSIAPQVLYQIHPSVSWPRRYDPPQPSKPPPRIRRPPKRYLTTESHKESSAYPFQLQPPISYTPPPLEPIVSHQPPEQPSVVTSQENETVNRVPKLTVKIPKLIIEKESTSDYSSESEDSDKLTVDMDAKDIQMSPREEDNVDINNVEEEEEQMADPEEELRATPAEDVAEPVESSGDKADSDVAVAGEDVAVTELTLDHPLDKYPIKELLKIFLNSTRLNCVYCNHARKIAVNAKQLGLHFVGQHRFSATVDSITAEELLPETIVQKIKSSIDDVENLYLNLDGFETDDKSEMKFYNRTLECFQCFYITTIQKELYLHNRKMHQKTILLCVMCNSNFYSYSELLCHMCPGTYESRSEIMFRCCLCPKDFLPSSFRLMIHLRKSHHTCEICLEYCHNQTRLSNHVWKHKLHHLCYRCGIAYRNKPDITKHLFWKHGTESVLCKKCLQKRWKHVYHFCLPPITFLCEECNLTFTRAVSLKVHKRIHNNDCPYPCTQENCQEKFVSKKLLKKHEMKHLEPPEQLEDPKPRPQPPEDDKNDIIVIDDKPDDVIDVTEEKDDKTTSSKPKKAKRNKKNKEKVNLLIDVNLPALNLSESDSSEESDSEAKKVDVTPQETAEAAPPEGEPNSTNEVRLESAEETKPEATVPDVWDNFKMYQAQMEKETCSFEPPKPRHVCDSDHDYCVIPMSEYEQLEEQHRLNMETSSPTKEKKKTKSKKKSNKKENVLSSSDSSSDSDSSCSCGSNCSCSSSSGSSSSSSSSGSDSESSSSPRRAKAAKQQKDSDTSAVDVVMPPPEPVELPIAESDLDTDETETDEDFYDDNPQRLANEMLTEKRNKLLMLASIEPSVNNGTYLDTSRPVTPEGIEDLPELKKKAKNKKKKKLKKCPPLVPPIKIPIIRTEEPSLCPPPNKITISLQTNSVIDKSGTSSPKILASVPGDHENKRASKRRRVPNKFYGYSSDEEYVQKQQILPKYEWNPEDLPSSSGIQQPPVVPDSPNVAEIMGQESKPIVSPKLLIKEQEPIYTSSEDEDSDSSREGALQINHPVTEILEPVNNRVYRPPLPYAPYGAGVPFPRPAGVRQAREGESVYCYCRCPYDEVSEMIACDAEGCNIEWFHFECVGIKVPPKGKWYCPDCRQKEEYYDDI